MPDTMSDRTQEILSAAREGRIPDEAREAARETVAKSRQAYGQFSGAAKEGLRGVEQALEAGYDNAKALNTTWLRNMAVNTEAAFQAAYAMAGARNVPEATQIYAQFVQQQMANVGRQTQEMFELSFDRMKASVGATEQIVTKAKERARRAVGE